MTVWIIWYWEFWKFIHMLLSASGIDHVRIYTKWNCKHESTCSLQDVCSSDFVIVCVPISVYIDTLRTIIPLLWNSSVLCDICTIKTLPVKFLSTYENVQYICTHPMFWPESYKKSNDSLTWLRLVICAHTLRKTLYDSILDFLSSLWLTIIHMHYEAHDKKIAETLFLTHFVWQIISYAWFDRTNIDTVSFQYLMDATECVAWDGSLFKDVRIHNPYCSQMIKKFLSSQNVVLSKLWGW